MDSLLEEVVVSHGGVATFDRFEKVTAQLQIKGLTWKRKGWPDALENVTVEVGTKLQWATYERFAHVDWRSSWRPDKVVVTDTRRAVSSERVRPRDMFAGHTLETPWDEMHLAYFSGYAIWNYLTTPFHLVWLGVEADAVGETEEDGERRRLLRVRYPAGFATHCRDQTFYVDDTGLIRRLDYRAEVAGAAPTAHYLTDYEWFDGIAFPTRRRAVRRNSEDKPDWSAVVVSIDTTSVTLS